MANLTIDDLPPTGTALDGTEEVPLWVNGVTEKCTTQDIATIAVNETLAQIPTASLGIAASEETLLTWTANGFDSWKLIGTTSQPVENGNTGTWVRSGSDGTIGALGYRQIESNTVDNVPAYIKDAQDIAKIYMRTTAGTPPGFIWAGVFRFPTATGTRRLFFGFDAVASDDIVIDRNANPSAAPNILGVGKDLADLTLFFMANDGSGTATKTDLGVTIATLLGKTVRLTMSAPRGIATVAIVLEDITTGTVLYSGTITLTSNIPDVDQLVRPILGANSGTSGSVAVKIDIHKMVLSRLT